jgi:outer membrane protein
MQFYIKKTVLCVLLFLNANSLFAQKDQEAETPLPLTLSQVWEKADAFSKAIKIKNLGVQGSVQEVKDARAERLPELSVGGNYEKATNIPVYENGLFSAPTQHDVIHTLYKIGADGYLNVYNGSKTNLNIAKEEVLYKIAIEQQHLTTSEIRLRAAAYYLDLQKNIIFKDLLIKDIADQEKQLKEIKQFLKHGVVLKSDVLRVELKLSRQQMSLIRIENDIILANQKLNILIGEPDERLVDPVEKLEPEALLLKSYDNYLSEATEKSFPYRISEQQTQLRKIQLKNVKANVAPQVGLYGNFNFANPQIFLYPYNPHLYSLGIVGVKASFAISSFYLNKHKEKAAQIELQQQETEHSDVQDNVRKQVKEAYLRYKESLIQIGVDRVNVDHAKENARIVSNTYFNQTSLITDLLDADIQLLQTRFDLATSQIAAQLQYYQLQNVIGTL